MSGTNPLPAGQWANIAPLASGNLAAGGNAAQFQQGTSNARPLRGPPASYVRQPYLGSPPSVQTITGFGSGAGAGVQNNGSDADQSQGVVAIRVGLNPGASGNVALVFPLGITAGQYVFLGDWFSAMSQNIIGNSMVLGWSGSRPFVTGETLLLAYQWAVSN